MMSRGLDIRSLFPRHHPAVPNNLLVVAGLGTIPGDMPPFDRYYLTLNGQPMYTGRAPVSLGMITGYWHNQRP